MQWVRGDDHRDPELVTQPLVHAPEQSALRVSMMPRSRTSPASSGGQTSSVARTTSMICTIGPSMAGRTSAEPTSTSWAGR